MEKETELKPKGIFLKMDWDELIMDLEIESVGKMIKNIYHYLNDREMIEMDKMENMLFRHTIIPVLEFNTEKYQKQVEHNRRVASKGGRKPKKEETQTNPLGLIETQNIPSGSFTNPEYPKDRDKEKVKERDIEIDKTKIKSDIDKMEKIVELDLKKIINEKEIDFCIKVKEAVKILDWSRFKLLIFHTDEKDVEIILSEIDKQYCLQGILDIKTLYPFLLDIIIK